MHIYAMQLDMSMTDIEFQFLMSFMPKETKSKIEHFKFKKDQFRTLLGRIMVKYLLNKHYGITTYTINYKTYGRPYLKDTYIDFNISHSGDWILCAVSCRNVGIDIEEMPLVEDNIKMFQMMDLFMSKEEQELFQNKADKDMRYSFYAYWTAKEAAIKLIGDSIGSATHYTVKWESDIAAIVDNGTAPMYIQMIPFATNYQVAMCSDKIFSSLDISVLPLTEVMCFLKEV